MFSFLLVARVGFTFGSLTEKLIRAAVSDMALMLVCKCVVIVVRTMVEAVRNDIATRDWHVGNIGFNEKGEPHTMKLVDWEGNRGANASESYVERMDGSMNCFGRYLPGPHKYIKDFANSVASEPADVQVNVNTWKSIMTSLARTFDGWWSSWKLGARRRDEYPTEPDLDRLSDELQRVARAALLHGPPQLHDPDIDTNVSGKPRTMLTSISFPTRSSAIPSSIPTRFSAAAQLTASPATMETAPIQRLVQSASPNIMSNALPVSIPVPIPTAERWDTEEATTVIQSLTTAGSHCDPTDSVGQRAARALVTAVVAESRLRTQEEYRHRTRPITANSKPLHERRLNDLQGRSGGFEDPDGHRPTQSREEGDFVNLLLSLLLHEMKIQKYMDRMSNSPLQARCVDELHSKNWKRFAGWTSMTFSQQAQCLREFLLFKFSMDPQNVCMLPGIGAKRKHRNNAQWNGFELTDAEMERLVADVMREYAEAIRQSAPAQ